MEELLYREEGQQTMEESFDQWDPTETGCEYEERDTPIPRRSSEIAARIEALRRGGESSDEEESEVEELDRRRRNDRREEDNGPMRNRSEPIRRESVPVSSLIVSNGEEEGRHCTRQGDSPSGVSGRRVPVNSLVTSNEGGGIVGQENEGAENSHRDSDDIERSAQRGDGTGTDRGAGNDRMEDEVVIVEQSVGGTLPIGGGVNTPTEVMAPGETNERNAGNGEPGRSSASQVVRKKKGKKKMTKDRRLGKGRTNRSGGRAAGSENTGEERGNSGTGENERTSEEALGHWRDEEVMALVRGWAAITKKSNQNELQFWASVGEYVSEHYNCERSKYSLRAKWKSFAPEVQLWHQCYKTVQLAKTTGNLSEEVIREQTHRLYRHRKKRDFKHVDAAMFLRSIPKFGSVDGTGGVRIDNGLADADMMRRVNTSSSGAGCIDRNEAISEGLESGRTVINVDGDNGDSIGRVWSAPPGNVGGGHTVNDREYVNSSNVIAQPAMTGGSNLSSIGPRAATVEEVGRRPNNMGNELDDRNGNDRNGNVGEPEITYDATANAGTAAHVTGEAMGTPVRRPQGVKATKRTLEDRLEEQKRFKVLGDIRDEMRRINERAEKALKEQKTSDRVMRLHTILRFIPQTSPDYAKYTKELCDLHEKENETNGK